MASNSTFSISMQKQIAKNNVVIDSEISRAFEELNFRSLLRSSGINKSKGYPAATIIFLMLLLPFIKRKITDFWNSACFENQINAKKDTFYRFLNHERFNWRKLIYLLAVKVIAISDQVPLRKKVLIADDTIANKSGKNMELVSYHFDHKSGRSVLGSQCLQLGFHNGINFFPIDVSFNTSGRRPNGKLRKIDKRTNGWRRRKEALGKKTDSLVSMLERAWKSGIDASFVLFDSWFAHDDLISRIYELGYGVVCRLKKGRVKYEYQGQNYTLKQLWQQVAKKQTCLIHGFPLRGVCLDVRLPKTGDVRVLFVSDGKKEWSAFLSTDIQLDASEILNYYALRWSIEVFFKDAKQMLYLGKEQSNTFDAAVASYSLVIVRYILLIYILNKRRLIGPIGPLFREISEDQTLLLLTEKLWMHVKELIIRSSHIFSYKFEPDTVVQLIDMIENIILKSCRLVPAKL